MCPLKLVKLMVKYHIHDVHDLVLGENVLLDPYYDFVAPGHLVCQSVQPCFEFEDNFPDIQVSQLVSTL